MQNGNVTALHIARIKGTPSAPVNSATLIAGSGIEGDRSCNPDNNRQVLVMDQETLEKFDLEPGQIKENITTSGLDLSTTESGQVLFVGDSVTLELVGPCVACGKMDAIRPGLLDAIQGQRGMLAVVINGGSINIGDTVRIEP